MAKKPDAARGKATRIGKIKKIIKNIKEKGTVGTKQNMSPGAMGGRTKAKVTPKQKGLSRIGENLRRQKLKGMIPMIGALKGAGGAGSAMSAQAMKLAKQVKQTGRLSVADLMRAKQMMMRRKGK